MTSSLPKVLHPVAHLPMLMHMLNSVLEAGATRRAVVVGNQAELVTEQAKAHDPAGEFFVQEKRLGTGHAVLAAREAIEDGFDDVLVVNGDTPLVLPQTLDAARAALFEGADIVVLGFETADPTGYGRMIMEADRLIGIREQKDTTVEEARITFCNSGIIAFRGDCILSVLDEIGNDNAQGEYYLTDAVEIANNKGLTVKAIVVPEVETMGVNDRTQLAEVENIWQERRRKTFMDSGISMPAPHTVMFSHDTAIGPDSIIEPYVVFGPGVTAGKGATIKSFSHLEGAQIGNNSVVGPYARLRPGSNLGDGVKIGNFVETKSVHVAEGAKINHLSYVGDAEIGAKANIGAGSITCNYDGVNKHRTIVGQGAFIGTNTSLVAPVAVGDHAMTAAGSVITQDVPDEAMAVERTEQENVLGLAKKLRERNEAIKAKKNLK